MVREYVYLNGAPLAQVESGEVLTYLHTDHLGTPRVGTNTSGVNVWSWASANNAFGATAPTGTKTVNLRFAGQYFDSESGLFYNINRYYDPKTGRYISSDPIGLGGGLSTFAYAAANPVMFNDPRGLMIWKGKITLVSIGPLVGGRVTLKAQCSAKINKEVFVDVWLVGGSLGLSIPFSATKSDIELDDGNGDNIDLTVFNGFWGFVGGGATLPDDLPGKPSEWEYGYLTINGMTSSSFKYSIEGGENQGFQGSLIEVGGGFSYALFSDVY